MRFINRYYLVALLFPLLLLALMPELRLPARSLALGWQGASPESGFVPYRNHQFLTRDPLDPSPPLLGAQIGSIANSSFPTELKRFELDKTGNRRPQGKLLAFAELANTHPDNALILVQALLSAAGSDGRVAGPWEDNWNIASASTFTPPPGQVPGTPYFPTSQIRPGSFTSEELVLGLQLAQRGQLLEPQNSFFDWMAARFLFAMHRDGQATQVLVAASGKTGFDMHWREFWPASIAALERERPLLAEEKVLVGGILLPQLSTLRHVTRMALWSAMQKEAAGDKAGAFPIERALARLTMLRCERGFFGIERLSAGSDLQSTWNASQERRWAKVFYVGRPLRKSASQADAITRSSAHFIGYCNALKDSDLARETTAFAPRLLADAEKSEAGRTPEAWLDLSGGGAMTRVGLWWFAAMVFGAQGVVAIGTWFGLTVFGPLLPPRGASVTHWNSRLVFYPVVLGGATLVAAAGVGAQFLRQGWAGGTAFCGFPLNDGAQYALTCATLAPALPFLLSTATIFVATARMKRTLERTLADSTNSLQEQSRLEWERVGFAPEAYQPFTWFWRAQTFFWFRGLPLIALGCGAVLLARGVLTWGTSSDTDNILAVLIGALGAWFVVLLGRWRFGMPQSQRVVVFAGFWALRRAAAWTIPLALWLLLGALWGAVPSRHILERQLPQYLQSENQGPKM